MIIKILMTIQGIFLNHPIHQTQMGITPIRTKMDLVEILVVGMITGQMMVVDLGADRQVEVALALVIIHQQSRVQMVLVVGIGIYLYQHQVVVLTLVG